MTLPRLIELRMLDLGLDRRSRTSRCPRCASCTCAATRSRRSRRWCATFTELRLLDLRANRLTSVPDWIAELPRLEKLDLRWNEVYEPPAALVERGCVVLCE